MVVFQVWAPNAKRVEVEAAGQRSGMMKAAGGWWLAEAPFAGAGTDYAFRLDGGEPLPDPRSAWQPRGVDGPSRVVSHDDFPWTDQAWQARPLAAAVIYEMHVGTFSPEGTFDAAAERLGHLVNLGVTHVEVMPIAQFPGDYGWGYDGVDLWAPHERYGGPYGFKRFVNACHSRGLGVILDVVYNHLGPSGNYLGSFGPYFTDRWATPWGEAVNLDGPGCDEVRRFFLDNAIMWLRDYHCDGLRLDAVHAFSAGSAVPFLEELSCEVRRLETFLGRHLILIAESDLNDPRLVRPYAVGGYGIDAQWSDDFHHALHAVLTGECQGPYVDFGAVAQLAKALRQGYVYDGCYSAFRGRRHGRSPVGLPGHAFLGYLQNHDQVGNRAAGERMSQLVSTDLLMVGAALVLTSPFVPLLFAGEEWGTSAPFQYFAHHEDARLALAVREGRRKLCAAFGFDPEDVPDPAARETLERSKPNWDEIRHEPHATLLAWHKDLIRLRRGTPSLCDGRLDQVHVRFDEAARWLVLERGAVSVACNFADRPQPVPLPPDRPRDVLLASEPAIFAGAGPQAIELPPESVAILGSAAQHPEAALHGRA